MDVDVVWPPGPWLEAEVTVMVDTGGAAISTVEVVVDRALAYAFHDGHEAAVAHGATPPDPREILLPEQRRTLVTWAQRWPALDAALDAAMPETLRGRVTWISLWLTDRVREGLAIARLTGVVDPGLVSPWGTDEVEAVVWSSTVLSMGRPGSSTDLPAPSRREVPLRANPNFASLTRDAAAAFIAQQDWDGLEAALDGDDARRMVDAALLDWLLDLPPDALLSRLPAVQHLLIRSDAELPGWMGAMGVPDEVQAALVRIGRFAPVGGAPVVASVPEPTVAPPPAPTPAEPPVVARRGRPSAPADDADADPLAFLRGMVLAGDDDDGEDPGGPDELGGGDADDEAWDGDDEPQQAGVDVLAIWLEREWIELTDDANAELVRFSLESLLDAHTKPGPVIDGLFEVPGVEEVYIDDDALEAFMDAW